MINVLCVCAVGIGSSLMLKINAEKIMKTNGFDAKIENTNVPGAGGQNPDILITTADILNQITNCTAKEIVILNNLVSKKELEEKLIPAAQKI